MLSKNDYKNIRMALRLIHAIFTKNPAPVVKLIQRQKKCKGYGTEEMLDNTAVAISEMILHSSFGPRHQAMAAEIKQVLKENTHAALEQCPYAREGLELIFRAGLFQFDRIVDILPYNFRSSYMQQLVNQVREWDGLTKPGIHSDKIEPVYYSTYQTYQALRNRQSEPTPFS